MNGKNQLKQRIPKLKSSPTVCCLWRPHWNWKMKLSNATAAYLQREKLSHLYCKSYTQNILNCCYSTFLKIVIHNQIFKLQKYYIKVLAEEMKI